jgi:hypothetical protein
MVKVAEIVQSNAMRAGMVDLSHEQEKMFL